MATFLTGVPAPQGGRLLSGTAMSPRDYAALQVAPKRRKGTQVTVRAYDVPGAKSLAGFASPDHMYVEYDDGQEQLIARGGPSAQGRGFARDLVRDDLRVVGEATPARENRDHGRGERVLFRGFVPDLSAQQAAEPARRNAAALDQDPRRYRLGSNSNSFAADAD